MGYDWNFSVFIPYLGAFARAAGVTLALSVISSFAGTCLGLGLGLALRIRPVSWILLPLNDAIRAIPMLVLMLFVYYFPYGTVFGISALSGFAAAALALTIAQTVFTADLVRAAVDGVPRSSVIGARALGLSRRDILRFIVIPDLIRQLLPPLVAFYIGNIKLSSLASVIGCHELVFVSRVAISQTYRSAEAWVLVAIVYMVFVLPLGWCARAMERSEWLRRR